MEALWVHQWHNVVDTNLLLRLLHSPQPEARAAAGRVLCYWRDRVPGALGLFKTLADDPNPRVRLEATCAMPAFSAMRRLLKTALDGAQTFHRLLSGLHVEGETLRQLKPWVLKAITNHQSLAADNPAGLNYLINSLNTAELLKLPSSIPTLRVPGRTQGRSRFRPP